MPELANPVRSWLWPTFIAIIVTAASTLALLSWINSRAPAEETVAEQWMTAVSRYGIEPIYPPEEDIYVGDVFAVIVSDAKRDARLGPLPTRAIRLTHLDLSERLENEYKGAFKFPLTKAPAEGTQNWTQDDLAASVFTKGGALKDLPIALLPDFKITSKKSGKLSSSLDEIGASFGFSGARDRAITLKPAGILTYGISAIEGELALFRFCKDPNYLSVCQEGGLRKQLSNLVGEEIDSDVVDPRTGRSKKRYEVEISLVTRVYLMRGFETEIDDGSDFSLDGAIQNPAGGDAAKAGATAAAESHNRSEISVKPQIFERPVVLGIRTVRRLGNG